MFYWVRFEWGKARKQKHTYLLIEWGKNRWIPFPANAGYRTATSDLEKGEWGRKSFAFSWAFFMFSLLFVRTLCLFQPLLSFVLLFGFLLCCFDFPSPLLFLLGIHFITLGLFFFFLPFSFSFFDLVHYHTWPFLFWPVRSGGSSPFWLFLFYTTTIILCRVVWWYYSIHSLYIMRKCGQSRPMIWFLRHLKEV